MTTIKLFKKNNVKSKRNSKVIENLDLLRSMFRFFRCEEESCRQRSNEIGKIIIRGSLRLTRKMKLTDYPSIVSSSAIFLQPINVFLKGFWCSLFSCCRSFISLHSLLVFQLNGLWKILSNSSQSICHFRCSSNRYSSLLVVHSAKVRLE